MTDVVPELPSVRSGSSDPLDESTDAVKPPRNDEGSLKDADVDVVPTEDQEEIDKEPTVTRRELWSYYLYYNGDNGVGPNGYSLTIFQSLATSAGFDPVLGPGSSCDDPNGSGQCVLPWAGGTKSVNSVVLTANGLSFLAMTLIFTTLGSVADYGSMGRWILFILTVVCWAAQFASMALTGPSKWGAAMAIYMIGYISYGATLVFYAAVFPRLARNTPHAKDLKRKYDNGEVDKEVYSKEVSLEMNRISNISTMHSNIGYLFTLAINLSVLLPLADNSLVNNYTIVLTNAYWVILGIWWFVFQQPRPGPKLARKTDYLTIGWRQIWQAVMQYRKLPYTFVYLLAFFLLADGLNSTGTLVSIVQNRQINFSFIQYTYLGLVQAITSIISTGGFWYIQKHWKIRTKPMFMLTNFFTCLIPLWGMIGMWTDKFGFHNEWEFWFYNVVFGLFQAPYYAFSQTMMSELTPPGFENMFFGLFGFSNRASSIIGPNVLAAISNKHGNWAGFPFLFALCTSASLVIWLFVDVEKGRANAVRFAEEKRAALRRQAGTESRVGGDTAAKDI